MKKWYLTVAVILLGLACITSCKEKPSSIYGEWIYYYAHGDSMVYQLDTAQMIVRKFALEQIQEPGEPNRDSVVSFERVFFYDKVGDTLFLDWAVPTDTGVQQIPSSYHTIKRVTADSLVLAPELGPDILFKKHSDKWPEQSKQQILDKYHNWLQRIVEGEE